MLRQNVCEEKKRNTPLGGEVLQGKKNKIIFIFIFHLNRISFQVILFIIDFATL